MILLGPQVPVILIGNKIDLRAGVATNQALMDGERFVTRGKGSDSMLL